MFHVIKASVLAGVGRLIARAATCEAPPPVEIQLPEKNRELAKLTREYMITAARFRAMTEHAWEVVACLGADCTIQYTTASVSRVLEYSAEELIGRIGFDLVYPEDRPRIMHLFDEVVLRERPKAVAYFRLVTKSGKVRWVQCTGTNLLGHSDVNAVVIYYHDITERRRVEEEAQKSRERLNLALKAGKMGTYDWDLLTGYAQWSEQTEQLFGFEPSEFSGSIEDVIARLHPDDVDRVKKEKEQAIENAQEYSVEYRIRLPNGEERWLMSRGQPLLDHRGRAVRVVGIVMDCTEQKNSERRLQEASLAKSQFLANMSHEIRTPLGAILGFADLIRDPQVSQSDRLHYAEIVHKNGHQLATVINDILDLSKVEAGKMEVQPCIFSLSSLVAETVSFLAPLAKQKEIRLEAAPPPGEIPDRVSSDPARVKQVLTNIIGNAIKFTGKGGRILVSLGLLKTHHHTCAVIRVKDTGIGIQMPILDGYQATELLRSKGYKGKIVALTAHALVDERAHSFAVGCDDHLTKPVNRLELIRAVARYAGVS